LNSATTLRFNAPVFDILEETAVDGKQIGEKGRDHCLETDPEKDRRKDQGLDMAISRSVEYED
jgi:hypothetical protein